MYTKNERLMSQLAQKKVLIAAHRGTCGGNLCQNTALTYKNALLHGADMIEIDATMSTDGEFYAFHNGEEYYVLKETKDVRTMSSKELESYTLHNWLQQPSGLKLNRLTEILDMFENQCLINIDRSWFYWEEMIRLLTDRKKHDEILLKSAPEPELLQKLEDSGSDIMYMPILKDVSQWETVKRYNINVAAAELLFASTDNPLVSPEMFAEFRELGIVPWVNAITLGEQERFRLSGEFDDNRAVREGFEAGWGGLVRMGFGIIQTDWPALLYGYLREGKTGILPDSGNA